MDISFEPISLTNGQLFNFVYSVTDRKDFEVALQKLKVEAEKISPTQTNPNSKKKYKPSDAGRLARKAAEVLADRPWVKGRIGNEHGMCALGVLNLTVCGLIPEVSKFHPLVAYTNELFRGWHGRSINGFNDFVATSKEDVIEMLLKFADHFDPKGARVR